MKTPNFLTETDTNQQPLGAELGKAFAVAAVSTVGMLAGTALYGSIKLKLEERRARKEEQVNPTESTEE